MRPTRTVAPTMAAAAVPYAALPMELRPWNYTHREIIAPAYRWWSTALFSLAGSLLVLLLRCWLFWPCNANGHRRRIGVEWRREGGDCGGGNIPRKPIDLTPQLCRCESDIHLISCSVVIKWWWCWCGHETITVDEFMECICVGIVLIAPATDFIVSNRSTQQLFWRDSVILLISCSVIIKCWLCWCGHETIAADEFMACFCVGIVLIAPVTYLLSRILLNNHSTILPMWWWCWCGHETTTVTVFTVSIVLWVELHLKFYSTITQQ